MNDSDKTTVEGAGEVAIRLRGLSKSFGSKRVLVDLDLDILSGEALIVLGGSGTGKSVLLKHMIGLLRPDAGTVEVEGVDLGSLDYRQITSFRRRFGMSFQEGALFDSMTVRENIAFPLERQTRMSQAEVAARVDECLRLLRLEGAGDRMPAELSGGMRRRVGFARAIALKPRILLFDEPTTGLDPVLKATVDELIMGLQAELGSTSVIITHDIPSALRVGDRIAMLHGGKIIAIAPPNQFRQLPDPRVQQFVAGRASGPLAEDTPRQQETSP